MARRLRVRQIKSASGHRFDQAATARALGIRRLHQAVDHNDTPQIRGMIFKIRHLVEVEELNT
ncbi:MAG: 50S ribosomal protein L30 [Candidatus Eisenbacteria bacterium]|jgi:large subunit ribosomal protein L30|uniref:50S ribosomal protein L30 n=1 Tax=Eiseniibacteriota bacterium TaxID=2212470 RepID=A0A538U5T9_UNCEI|nr:MAG: 50S ribosomal protein L30 [Candidatus Eisenbacteria bacterium]